MTLDQQIDKLQKRIQQLLVLNSVNQSRLTDCIKVLETAYAAKCSALREVQHAYMSLEQDFEDLKKTTIENSEVPHV